jgi:dipeptidyl aminopeptidase/acylaminoacyl peptidase
MAVHAAASCRSLATSRISSAWIGRQKGERLFGATIDVVSIVNIQSFLGRRAVSAQAREVSTGARRSQSPSPRFTSRQLNVPLFIAHGFHDPRVPVVEAIQLAIALKERKQSPRVFIAPDEGHGFQKLDNRIYFNERALQFLDETIGAAAKAGSPEGGTASKGSAQ